MTAETIGSENTPKTFHNNEQPTRKGYASRAEIDSLKENWKWDYGQPLKDENPSRIGTFVRKLGRAFGNLSGSKPSRRIESITRKPTQMEGK